MSEEKAYLPYLIDEPIYVLKEERAASSKSSNDEHSTDEVKTESENVLNDQPTKVDLKPIVTFGENLKHCIVLFSAEHKISPESKDLLFKILAAIKRSPKDALMANVYGCSQEQVEALLSEHNHKHLISFDIRNASVLSPLSPYEPASSKGKHYILSNGLEEVATDINKKKALWQALQKVFH